MGRVAAAGAGLVALVVLGAPPGAGAELSEVFQFMGNIECHYINGTEKLRLVMRFIYNREELLRFDSDVELFVGFTPYGEIEAVHLNSKTEILEHYRAQVGIVCLHNYEIIVPFSVERRDERGAGRVPSGRVLGMTLEPLKTSLCPQCVHLTLALELPAQPQLPAVVDFYPAQIQLKWFQGQQEHSRYVVATDLVPNGDWISTSS